MAWTDERIDDAIKRIDQRFDAVERRLDHLTAEIVAVHRQLNLMGWGLAVAFMAQFVAFVVTRS